MLLRIELKDRWLASKFLEIFEIQSRVGVKAKVEHTPTHESRIHALEVEVQTLKKHADTLREIVKHLTALVR